MAWRVLGCSPGCDLDCGQAVTLLLSGSRGALPGALGERVPSSEPRMSKLPPANPTLTGPEPSAGHLPTPAPREGTQTPGEGDTRPVPQTETPRTPGTCGFPARDRPEWQITGLAILQSQQLSGQPGGARPAGPSPRQHRRSGRGRK